MDDHAHKDPSTTPASQISRREFLQVIGAAAAGSLLTGCGLNNLAPTGTASTSPVTPATNVAPTGTAPTSPVTPITYTGPRPLVAIAQANSYDRTLIRQQVQEMFDKLGGVEDIVGPGDKIAIKVNLTGGVGALPQNGEPATEYHILHPEVVRAVGELLRDAGAKELYIVEAVSDAQSFPQWGFTDVAKSLDATLVDLNQSLPYPDFATVPVGAGYYLYENFILNRLLEEVDAFVSVAKFKSHCTAGVTFSMKNLVGIAPVRYYRQSPQDGYRTAFHGTAEGKNTRIPRIIVDLNRARPIHLAVIDGVSTCEGGEGPWNINTKQVKPGVLLAGKNALATDAVATSVMGFDPTSEGPEEPFLQSDNHLNLAYQMGLGTNRLDEIDTVGVKPEGVRIPFAPCREW